MNYLLKNLLYVLSFPIFSRIYGCITRLERPKFLIRFLVDLFMNTYNISMDEYEGKVGDYKSLASFFVRKLDRQKRELKQNKNFLLSPADGIISSIEQADSAKTIQAKGIEYDINEFLNKEIDFTNKWYITTIYLSPKDYHRFHFPLDGIVKRYCHLKGHLYPVNKMGLKNIKNLFVKNERIILEIISNDTLYYACAVGATFVGSIKMNFIEKYKRDNKWKYVSLNVSQMDEMGRFELGSTIILITPQSLGTPVKDNIGKHVKTGEKLFTLKK